MSWLKAILVSLGLVSASPPPPKPITLCQKACEVSEAGYNMVRTFEGYMPFPYKDIAGNETVGYGYMLRAGDSFTYPMLPPDADKILKMTMSAFERDINRFVNVPLLQYQFDALASLTYNIGSTAFKSSTLLKRVNAGRHEDVPNCFLMWNKARIDGVLTPVSGLTVRRQQEANHYAGK